MTYESPHHILIEELITGVVRASSAFKRVDEGWLFVFHTELQSRIRIEIAKSHRLAVFKRWRLRRIYKRSQDCLQSHGVSLGIHSAA